MQKHDVWLGQLKKSMFCTGKTGWFHVLLPYFRMICFKISENSNPVPLNLEASLGVASRRPPCFIAAKHAFPQHPQGEPVLQNGTKLLTRWWNRRRICVCLSTRNPTAKGLDGHGWFPRGTFNWEGGMMKPVPLTLERNGFSANLREYLRFLVVYLESPAEPLNPAPAARDQPLFQDCADMQPCMKTKTKTEKSKLRGKTKQKKH